MTINWRKTLSPLGVLLICEMIGRAGLIDPFFLPTPSAMLTSLWGMTITGEIFPHVGISILRALSGYLIAAVLGLFIGLLVAWSRIFETIFDPLIELIRPISTFALVPVMFVWFGIGNASKTAIIVKGCFFPIVINTIAGIKGVDARLVQAARSLGAEGRRLWTMVLIPSAMPSIITGMRISTAMSMLSIVGVEMLAADSGIGFLVIDAQRTFATDRMFAGIIVISLMGFFLDRVARLVQKRVLSWHTETSMAGIG
ncbi:MAG: ABC transporter permease [Desulfobacteraceae bacterium]|nr:ABC transporter permease [Desulfobacteraceae bacterium]MBU4038067.1 ABC transporter permease [Pseudomonadota bacterium]